MSHMNATPREELTVNLDTQGVCTLLGTGYIDLAIRVRRQGGKRQHGQGNMRLRLGLTSWRVNREFQKSSANRFSVEGTISALLIPGIIVLDVKDLIGDVSQQ